MFSEQKHSEKGDEGVRKTLLKPQVSALCIHRMYPASRTENKQGCNGEMEGSHFYRPWKIDT